MSNWKRKIFLKYTYKRRHLLLLGGTCDTLRVHRYAWKNYNLRSYPKDLLFVICSFVVRLCVCLCVCLSLVPSCVHRLSFVVCCSCVRSCVRLFVFRVFVFCCAFVHSSLIVCCLSFVICCRGIYSWLLFGWSVVLLGCLEIQSSFCCLVLISKFKIIIYSLTKVWLIEIEYKKKFDKSPLILFSIRIPYSLRRIYFDKILISFGGR